MITVPAQHNHVCIWCDYIYKPINSNAFACLLLQYHTLNAFPDRDNRNG